MSYIELYLFGIFEYIRLYYLNYILSIFIIINSAILYFIIIILFLFFKIQRSQKKIKLRKLFHQQKIQVKFKKKKKKKSYYIVLYYIFNLLLYIHMNLKLFFIFIFSKLLLDVDYNGINQDWNIFKNMCVNKTVDEYM